MSTGTRAAWAGIAVVILLVLGGAAALLIRPGQGPSTTGSGTTIEDILAGKYPSALDKQGTGGVSVSVRTLFVLYVHNESDGDWHVGVTDGRVPVFITEIIPRDQALEGRPQAGTTIDETGTPFCDAYHQNENWHGYTCWEIHPVTAWHLSAQNLTVTTMATDLQGLNLSVSYAQNPIASGAEQNITVKVFDSDGPVVNQTVFVHVDYPSGITKYDFTCETYDDGACSVHWVIGLNATSGTYGVTVDVNGREYRSVFEVT